MKNKLTDCQRDFILSRVFDRKSGVAQYTCEHQELGIAVNVENCKLQDLTSMDDKALKAISPYCNEKCELDCNY